jgi:chromosomal replication initiation ATPase DnaA
VEWVRDEFLKTVQPNRELPALKRLGSRLSPETIHTAVADRFGDKPALVRRVAMYLCRRHTELGLKEIGAVYGVGESAVTQASRRVEAEMERNRAVRESIALIEETLKV